MSQPSPADRLYTPTPKAGGSNTPAPTVPGPGPAPARLPDEEVMYPADVALRPAFHEHDDKLHDVLGLTREQREARQQEFTADIRALRLDPYVLGNRLYGLAVAADLADHRGDDEDDARYQADAEAARRQVRETYGDQAEALMASAQKFVSENKRLHALLGRRGIGSRPEVVIPLVEHVRRINFK